MPPTDYDNERLIQHGLLASMRVVDRVQEFARQEQRHVLYVLSYGAYTLRQFIDTGRRFDQALVDYLNQAGLPYVDLMLAHQKDSLQYRGSTDQGLARYFIGHYNPLGNMFCAFAIKDALVKMLDPRPRAYRR